MEDELELTLIVVGPLRTMAVEAKEEQSELFCTEIDISKVSELKEEMHMHEVCLFVLRFYGPVNPMGSCQARSVYLTTHLLGKLSPLCG